ncbi:MAG: adenosylhomocysteinase [Candidatus Methanofastidiosa archaeon]|nr:adenosylhomocysteinase [Candidatus Methanofastidiosa archaeon]
MSTSAHSGEQKIEWAAAHMPVVAMILSRYRDSLPFAGMNVACCLHLEAKTAYTAYVLKEGGARVALCGSNPLTTQDDVAAALSARGVEVHARYGLDAKEYYENMHAVLDTRPNVVIDDGGDLAHLLHTERTELLAGVRGLCEETTTGVLRLAAMARESSLRFPAIAVNDARCKHLFDNRYGTGQSTMDGIMRTTNRIIAGKTVVVAGYGWCGKGIALRAKGMGARVIVTEVDPVKAIEAHMDGFAVMPMADAAPQGDFFVTATGCADVISHDHFPLMKDGAVLCNAGHFDVEVNVRRLAAMADGRKQSRANIESFRLGSRWVHVLGEGRLVNLACADGHPAEIMDMSFALQLRCAEYLAATALEPGLYPVPEAIDMEVARMKLSAESLAIDTLTPAQEAYLSSWRHGT